MGRSAVSKAGSALVGRRYAKMTAEERSRAASKAASASWAGLTPEERKAEMKRILAGKTRKKKGGDE